MRGSLAKHLAVGLTGTRHVLSGDGREGEQLDRVDLDLEAVARVPTAGLDLGPLPQSDRHRDVARADALAQLRAEHHAASVSCAGGASTSRASRFWSGAALAVWAPVGQSVAGRLTLQRHPHSLAAATARAAGA